MIRHTARSSPLVRRSGRQQMVHPLAVSAAIVETLEGLDLCYPKVDAAKHKEIKAARQLLEKKFSCPVSRDQKISSKGGNPLP